MLEVFRVREWLESKDPRSMLEAFWVREKARKLKLFSCAIWRRAGLPDENLARLESQYEDSWSEWWGAVFCLVVYINGRFQASFFENVLRDLFGNPFRPVTFNRSWLTPNVIHLAQQIYEDRAFDSLPNLTDALEKAGCDNPEIPSSLPRARAACEGMLGCGFGVGTGVRQDQAAASQLIP
jgi:hypothetical protein